MPSPTDDAALHMLNSTWQHPPLTCVTQAATALVDDLYRPSVSQMLSFLRSFCTTLLACGAQTSRVDRNAQRIGEAYGFNVDIAMFSRHLMLTVSDTLGGGSQTAVCTIPPGGPNFSRVSALNALGWRIVDEHLPLREAWRDFESIMTLPSVPPLRLRLLVACANAAFCRLFEGDVIAMLFVFFATFAGFYVRQKLTALGVNHKVVFIVAAFAASLTAAPAVIWQLGTTPQTALGVSVLFLIPGIPLINAMHDILDGHVLMGVARAIQASVLIVCIAIGLSLTMLLLGVWLL